MSFLIQNFNIYTYLQLLRLLLLIFVPLILFVFANRKITQNRKLAVISVISVLLSVGVYLLSTTLTQRVFGRIDDGLLLAAFTLLLGFNWLNLIYLLLRYNDELKLKSQDLDHVTRSHFSKTLDLGVILLITGFTFIPFVPIELAKFFIIVIPASIAVISINHLMARRLIRDEK